MGILGWGSLCLASNLSTIKTRICKDSRLQLQHKTLLNLKKVRHI